MSVETMALVFNHSAASDTEKVVLLGIANHDGDGGSWPSIKTLAKYARKSDRTVQRAIRALVAAGELRVEECAGGNRETPHWARTNRYEVLVTCPPDCDGSSRHQPLEDTTETAAEPVDNPEEPSSDPVTHVSPGGNSDTGSTASPGDTPDTTPVTHVSPEPSSNQEPPLPPASGGSCPRHTDHPGTCCRACGTTPRQLAEQQRVAEAAARRDADRRASAEGRARRAQATGPPPDLVNSARRQIATAAARTRGAHR